MSHQTKVELTLVTCPNQEQGQDIAHKLVTEKLAACVNILPQIQSIYSWQGQIQNETEVLMLIKSDVLSRDALQSRVLELHPYDTPEFLTIAAEHVKETYKTWLRNCIHQDE